MSTEIPTPQDLLRDPHRSMETFLDRCIRILKVHDSHGASPSIPPQTPFEEIDDAIEKLEAAGWKVVLSESHKESQKMGRRWRTLVILNPKPR